MSDMIVIGWAVRSEWDLQHYWRARNHMKTAISACWKIAPKVDLLERENETKCGVCLFHTAQDRAIQLIPERTERYEPNP